MTDRPEPARLTREEIDDIEREARAWIDAIAVNPRERVFLQQGCELAEGALSLVAHVRALEAKLDELADFLWETEPEPECAPDCQCLYDWARTRVESRWARARQEASDDDT